MWQWMGTLAGGGDNSDGTSSHAKEKTTRIKASMMYIKINQLHLCVLPFDYGCFVVCSIWCCEVYKYKSRLRFRIQSYAIRMHQHDETEMKNHFSTFNSPFNRHARFEQSVRLHSACDLHVLVGLILMPTFQYMLSYDSVCLKPWKSSSIPLNTDAARNRFRASSDDFNFLCLLLFRSHWFVSMCTSLS